MEYLRSGSFSNTPSKGHISSRQNINLPKPGPVSTTAYNAANQMLTFNTENITYDLNGNMTSVTNSCGTTTYTWDVRNRLTGISGYKPDCSTLTASFSYDALGRRTQKTINGRTIQYLYDGNDIAQEKENGLVSVNYIRTMNIDEPLARIDAATGFVRYYHADALGSIIGLSDESGQMVTTYAYDAFGQVAISGEISDNPFQYTGRENDGTGLYYYRARYYSPELQRFISEDPIGLKGGINKYAYTADNPVNRKDPKGLDWSNVWFGTNWYGNWCGPGGAGRSTDCHDAACKRHDACYDKCGIDASQRLWHWEDCVLACDLTLLKEWRKCSCSNGASGHWGSPGVSGGWSNGGSGTW